MINYRIPELGLRVFMLWDCSVYERPLFPRTYHFLDLLWVNHRRWWQPPIVGFQFWGSVERRTEVCPGCGRKQRADEQNFVCCNYIVESAERQGAPDGL